MNRGTNSLTLESGMWVLIVLFVSLLPSIWSIVPHDVVIWGGFGVLLAMLFVWLNILNEHYHSVHYIEHDLRKRIADLLAVDHERFWQYEPHIGHQRPESQPFLYESAPAVVASALFIWIAWYRYRLPDRQFREYYEFAIDLALLSAFVWANARMMRVRRSLVE